MPIKCDLHVHSKYSNNPTNWFLTQMNCPESLVEPKHIYETAMKRGMTHVTITDHNTIEGAKEIAHLPNVFISSEVTAYFPDGCKVHVLVYDIDDEEFEIINTLRKNIHKLIAFLNYNHVFHSLAHPLYSVNGKLTQDHVEQLLLMFNVFEINGGCKTREINNKIKKLVKEISTEKMIELFEKHNGVNGVGDKLDPNEKIFTCGGDDHSGIFVGRNYLENPGDTVHSFFINGKESITNTEHAEPMDLAYNLYSIGYQYLSSKFKISKHVNSINCVNKIDSILLHPDVCTRKHLGRFRKILSNLKRCKYTDSARDLTKAALWKAIDKLEDIDKDLNVENASKKWFELVSTVVNESVKEMTNEACESMSKGDVFNLFRVIGALGSLYFIISPYYVGYYTFQENDKFSRELTILKDEIEKEEPKVAHFTDTFYETNGVAITLKNYMKSAFELGKKYDLITSSYDNELGEVNFEPVMRYDLPGYKDLKMDIPPVLDILQYCYDKKYTHIHSSTPGPLGLCALLVAKLLHKPFYATYHTAIPEYISMLIGDKFIEDVSWLYLKWYYSKADKIFVPSRAFRDELVSKGIDTIKIYVTDRGVDTKLFIPKENKEVSNPYDLLYVGRVSKEKNLDMLISVMDTFDNVKLNIVGDGPYRKELEKQFEEYDNVKFSGELQGEELVAAYQAADVFVFPSTSDTFGLVILEAHACGLPTVVSDIGGPQENVREGETGIITKGNDISSLVEGIRSMLNKEKIKYMSNKCIESVADLDLNKVFLNYWEHYK